MPPAVPNLLPTSHQVLTLVMCDADSQTGGSQAGAGVEDNSDAGDAVDAVDYTLLQEILDLLDLEDGDGGEQFAEEIARTANVKDGTVKWYVEHLHDPLYHGARPGLTVLKVVFVFSSLKRGGHIRNTTFGQMCRLIHAILPDGNLFPPAPG